MSKTKSILTAKIKPLYLLLGILLLLIFIYLFVDFQKLYSMGESPMKSSLPVQTDLEGKGLSQTEKKVEEEPYVFAGVWADNFQFIWPNKMIQSPSGDFYLLERNRDRVWKFTREGERISDFSSEEPGSRFKGDGQYRALPEYLTIDKDSNLYVTGGRDSKILKFDSDGNFIRLWKSYALQEAYGGIQYVNPGGIAIDRYQDMYVADGKENCIHKLDSEGNFIKRWGSTGNGPGQFKLNSSLSYGIAIDFYGYVYVCDAGNYRIQKFDSDGNFILEFGRSGSGDGQFNNPADIIISPDHKIYVVDQSNHRIQIFSLEGKWLGKWGKYGYQDGQFALPVAIMIDDAMKAYVISHAEKGGYKIQVFTPSKSNPDK